MARYIDADKLKEECLYYDTEDDLERYVKTHGYSDVVPMSEVEELIAEFDKMVDLISAMTGLNVLAYGGKFAELRKKYTE